MNYRQKLRYIAFSATIMLIGLTTLIGCSEQPEPIIERGNYKNTPPIVKGINLPPTVSTFQVLDLRVDMYDKEQDPMEVTWVIDVETLNGTITETKKQLTIGWRVPDEAHSITITAFVTDLRPIETPGIGTEYKAINVPVKTQASTVVRDANGIIPGKRVGPLSIGAHINTLDPTKTTPMPRKPNGFIYRNNGYTFYGYYNTSGTIILITVPTNSTYKTPAGNGISSGSTRIQLEFGKPQEIEWSHKGPAHIYRDKGIAFGYQHGVHVARTIAVFNDEGYEEFRIPIIPDDMTNVIIVK